MNKLKPKLADTMPGSYNVGVEQISERISKKTSAIVVVHAIGYPAPIDEIKKLADINNLRVIEDCSQTHGATLNSQQVGTFGDISAFSTMYRKAHITGGSGGIVFSKDIDIYHMAQAHADRGKPRWLDQFDDRDPENYLFPALNLNTDEISCAIGIASLKRLNNTISNRRSFVKMIEELIQAGSNVLKPYPYYEGISPFIYPIEVIDSKNSVNKHEFARTLIAEGIPLNPHYKYLVMEWPWIRKYLADDYITYEAMSIRDKTFCLYLNENYGATEAKDIVDAIHKVETAFTK